MHEKKQRRGETDMLVFYTDRKQSERPALAATEISVSSSSSESQVPQILPVTSSIIHLGEFDFIAPPSLPDANSPSLPAKPTATPWNAKPTRQSEKAHITRCAGDWQEHIFLWQLNGNGGKCCCCHMRVCVCVRLDTCKLLLLEKPVFFFPPRWAGGRADVHGADSEAHCEEAAAWLDAIQRLHQREGLRGRLCNLRSVHIDRHVRN